MSIRRHVSLLLVAVTVALVGNVSVAGFASAWSQEVGGDYAGMTEAAGSGQPAINRTPTRPLALKLAPRLEGAGDGGDTAELPVLPGWPPPADSVSARPVLPSAQFPPSPPRPLQGRDQIPRAPPFSPIV